MRSRRRSWPRRIDSSWLGRGWWWGAAGGARRELGRGRSTLRADATAVLASGGRRGTRCAHCVRCARTAATGQLTTRAARAHPDAARLVAPDLAPGAHRLPHPSSSWCSASPTRLCRRGVGSHRARMRGAEARRVLGRARSALRPPIRRGCPSAANAVSAVSSATRPRTRAPQGSRRAAAAADPARLVWSDPSSAARLDA
jgi:hypothetical protein